MNTSINALFKISAVIAATVILSNVAVAAPRSEQVCFIRNVQNKTFALGMYFPKMEGKHNLEYDFVAWESESFLGLDSKADITRDGNLKLSAKNGNLEIELKNLNANADQDVSRISIKSGNANAEIYTMFNHSGFKKSFDGKEYYNQIGVECPGLLAGPGATSARLKYKECSFRFHDKGNTKVIAARGRTNIEITDNAGALHRLSLVVGSGVSIRNRNDGRPDSSYDYTHPLPNIAIYPLVANENLLQANETLSGTIRIAPLPQVDLECK